jgi:hypothetical protein
MIITLPYPQGQQPFEAGRNTAKGIGSSAVGSFEKNAPTINFSSTKGKGEVGGCGGTASYDSLIFPDDGKVLWTDLNSFLDCPRMITDNHQPLLLGRHSASLMDEERINEPCLVLESEEDCSHGGGRWSAMCRSPGLPRPIGWLGNRNIRNSHWSEKNQNKSENIRKKSGKNRKLNRNKSKQIPKVQYF